MIDGRKIADQVLEPLKEKAVFWSEKMGRKLRLVTIMVGQDAGTEKFLEIKEKTANEIGIDFKIYKFDGNISTRKLRKEVQQIAKAKTNNGVLVELPLSDKINEQYILNAVPEDKDVDVLSQKSQGAFYAGRSKILPPAVEAVRQIIREVLGVKDQVLGNEEDLKNYLLGKNVVVFGYGLLVGKPLVHWFSNFKSTTTVIQEFTQNPSAYSTKADIIITGVGKGKLITGEMIKDDALVIDFGFNVSLENGKNKVVGDVDFKSVFQKTALVTPVPGGVGPIVVASVLKNLITLTDVR